MSLKIILIYSMTEYEISYFVSNSWRKVAEALNGYEFKLYALFARKGISF